MGASERADVAALSRGVDLPTCFTVIRIKCHREQDFWPLLNVHRRDTVDDGSTTPTDLRHDDCSVLLHLLGESDVRQAR